VPWRSERPPEGDAGAVTVELALGLPVLALLVAVVLATTAAGLGSLRCADAARTGARVAALGEPDATVAASARRVAGAAAEVSVQRSGGWVEVVVQAPAAGGWFTGGPLAVRGSATAWVEP